MEGIGVVIVVIVVVVTGSRRGRWMQGK